MFRLWYRRQITVFTFNFDQGSPDSFLLTGHPTFSTLFWWSQKWFHWLCRAEEVFNLCTRSLQWVGCAVSPEIPLLALLVRCVFQPLCKSIWTFWGLLYHLITARDLPTLRDWLLSVFLLHNVKRSQSFLMTCLCWDMIRLMESHTSICLRITSTQMSTSITLILNCISKQTQLHFGTTEQELLLGQPIINYEEMLRKVFFLTVTFPMQIWSVWPSTNMLQNKGS